MLLIVSTHNFLTTCDMRRNVENHLFTTYQASVMKILIPALLLISIGFYSSSSHAFQWAMAWCHHNDNGTFTCMGPLQKMVTSRQTLEAALETVGCTEGKGFRPQRGSSFSFDCGRPLKDHEKAMPTYDPY